MSKAAWEDSYEMEPEYDFSDAIKNPYANRFAQGSRLILLDPDVAETFSESAQVNEALRRMIRDKATADLPKAS